uniref:Hypothetical conserved protein n=1 Tax=Glossina morsitans morsitans TaxID=37546 RepID=D3TN64_GLOMM
MAEEINCLRPATSVPIASCEGEYTWTYREPLLHMQKYSPLIRIIDFVENNKCRRFYEPSERFQMLISACMLRQNSPFCQTRRFPEDYWANLSVGQMANALDNLVAALDIPTTEFYGHIQVAASDLDNYKQKFNSSMEELQRLVHCTDLDKLADIGVYNRQTFEQRFNMQWYEHGGVRA